MASNITTPIFDIGTNQYVCKIIRVDIRPPKLFNTSPNDQIYLDPTDNYYKGNLKPYSPKKENPLAPPPVEGNATIFYWRRNKVST